jgi:dCMP deaminase
MTYTKNKAHLNAARGYAKLSKARRLQVGAVLVRDNRIISVGYNGCVSGGSNVLEEQLLEGPFPGELVTKQEVIHAELNCILFAAREGISTNKATMILTHSPCISCAPAIIQSGIKEVLYETEYRDMSGVEFLKANRITIGKIL